MFKSIKRTITLILTIAMFAIMSTSAFAEASGWSSYIWNEETKTGYYTTCSGAVTIGNALNASNLNLASPFLYREYRDRYEGEYGSLYESGIDVRILGIVKFNRPLGTGETTDGTVINYDEIAAKMPHTPGLSETVFDPEEKLTRENWAIMVKSACAYVGYTGNPEAKHIAILDLDDCKTEEGKAAVQFCVDNGLMEPVQASTYKIKDIRQTLLLPTQLKHLML